jgi:hypothetical protein
MERPGVKREVEVRVPREGMLMKLSSQALASGVHWECQ